jgi:hypothetical protein
MDTPEYVEAVKKEIAGFLSYLTATGFVVESYLTYLTIQGVIDLHEREQIKHEVGPVDKAEKLCNLLRNKGSDEQWALVQIFRDHKYNGLADNLAARLRRLDALRTALVQQQQAQPQPQPQPQPQINAGLTDNKSRAPKDPWLHTDRSYELELRSYEKLFHKIDATDGALQVSVKIMTEEPSDKISNENQYYDITGEGKGLALLINNHEYAKRTRNNEKQYNDRRGSPVDNDNMHNLLVQLGYEVISETNRKGDDMLHDVQNFATKLNQKPYRSCIVVIMTHGEKGQFIGVDGESLDQETFFKPIVEHKAMVSKPKIFIIQACRGVNYNFGEVVHDGNEELLAPSMIQESEKECNQAFSSRIPMGADTCYLYSTTPGYYSWRNINQGSWFIQTICKEFYQNAHKPWADLMTLAIRVTNIVGTKFECTKNIDNDKRICVQLPHTEMNMMKKFHFFPGK